jgi:uncharacterized membrane protein YphA (DoxX/SURF4 family)
MNLQAHVGVVLRVGLAFVFGWFGIDKFLNVEAWHGWIPAWMSFVPANPFLYALGAAEVLIALFLIGGRFVRLSALACAAFLFGVVASFGINEITVRDIGLIAVALALAMLPEPRKYHDLHQIHKYIKRSRR